MKPPGECGASRQPTRDGGFSCTVTLHSRPKGVFVYVSALRRVGPSRMRPRRWASRVTGRMCGGAAIKLKALPVSRIDRVARTDHRTRPSPGGSAALSACVAVGGLAQLASRALSMFPRRRCIVCWSGTGSIGSIILTGSRGHRSDGWRWRGRVNLSTLTSRNSDGFPKVVAGGSTAAAKERGRWHHTKVGYAFVHTAIDGYSRLAYSEVLPNEQGTTAADFWLRAAAFFAAHNITIERVLTDNGGCYRSRDFAHALDNITHTFTQPYRPATNGKVERFNRTLLAEWAYARPWRSDGQRTRALARWLHTYNHHRHHTAIDGPPISRVGNVSGHYS